MTRAVAGGMAWDPRLTAWLDRVEANWALGGVSPLAAGELRARLVEDLAQAIREGAPVDDLIGVDEATFARDVATASGCDHGDRTGGPASPLADSSMRPRRRTRSQSPSVGLADRTSFIGAVLLGALASATAAAAVMTIFGGTYIAGLYDWVFLLGFYVFVGLVAAAGGAAGVLLVFHDDARRTRLASSAGIGVLATGAVVTLLTVGFAATTGYSTLPMVVLAEMVLVVVGLVGGLILTTRLAWRRTDRSGQLLENAL